MMIMVIFILVVIVMMMMMMIMIMMIIMVIMMLSEGSPRQDNSVEVLWSSDGPQLGPQWLLVIGTNTNLPICIFFYHEKVLLVKTIP